MNEGTLTNEEAAERLTNIAGWICKTCRTFYGDQAGAERAARYCCEKDHACDLEGCPNRAEKPYIYCKPCRDKKDRERWLALPEVEWDGETPLVLHDDDTYFFSADDLQEYLDEHGLTLEQVQLVVAVPEEKPQFDMSEHLSDYLPEGMEMECAEDTKINAVVNRWIEKHAPDVWVPGATRPTLASMTPLFVSREAE